VLSRIVSDKLDVKVDVKLDVEVMRGRKESPVGSG